MKKKPLPITMHEIDSVTLHIICEVLGNCHRFFDARDQQNSALHGSSTQSSRLTNRINLAVDKLQGGENWIP